MRVLRTQWNQARNPQEKDGWKTPDTWKLKYKLLNNSWVKEISRETLQFLELNENENTVYENEWGVVTAVPAAAGTASAAVPNGLMALESS